MIAQGQMQGNNEPDCRFQSYWLSQRYERQLKVGLLEWFQFLSVAEKSAQCKKSWMSDSSGHDERVNILSERYKISKQSFAMNWAQFGLLVAERLIF
jgi:hypothetical protein